MTRSVVRGDGRQSQTEDVRPLSEIVLTTVRMLMSYEGLTPNGQELAKATGLGRSACYAKMKGESEFTVPELGIIAERFKVPVTLLLTGITIDSGTLSQIRCSVTDPVTGADVIDLREASHQREQAVRGSGSFTLPTFDDLCGHPAGSRPAKRHDSAGPGRNRASSRGPGRGTSNVPRHRDAA